MTIVQINQTYQLGSTGKIMSDMNDVICRSGHSGYMAAGYAYDRSDERLYCMEKHAPYAAVRKDLLISRISGKMGYRYKARTKAAMEWIDEKKPDIIHLHNIHGGFINLEALFSYINTRELPVVWTLHDCWPFTGRCSHFELCGCQKWKSGCYGCRNRKVYPITYFFDRSKEMWEHKRRLFTQNPNMTLVTPSHWLARYVQESFLGKYPVKVIHNGIDTEKYSATGQAGIHDKKIVLGVASNWSEQKGFFDFLKLDTMLDHEKYQIVMVGLNARQKSKLPQSILGIERTNNERELIDLYSSASVFLNLTYQDNFPTTNLEALSCGTPVITYRTGGSVESVTSQTGAVVKQGDIAQVVREIERICGREKIDRQLCSRYAKAHFDKKDRYDEYLALYQSML